MASNSSYTSSIGTRGSETKNFGRGVFTVEEEASIETALRKRLGPAFISQRPAGGGKHYFVYIHQFITTNKNYGSFVI